MRAMPRFLGRHEWGKSSEPLWVRIALVALVTLCIALGGVVWWQLLSDLP